MNKDIEGKSIMKLKEGDELVFRNGGIARIERILSKSVEAIHIFSIKLIGTTTITEALFDTNLKCPVDSGFDIMEIYRRKNIFKRSENSENSEILDQKEKEYLNVVIKPFKNRVISIKKVRLVVTEYVEIKLSGETMNLPAFKKGKMYKGMEANKQYTLEELGL